MKPVPIIAFLAVLMGCNAEEIRDWDDDKLFALGVLYDHHNRTHLTSSSTYMTAGEVGRELDIDRQERVDLLLKHFHANPNMLRRSAIPTVF